MHILKSEIFTIIQLLKMNEETNGIIEEPENLDDLYDYFHKTILSKKNVKPQKITIKLIMDRNLTNKTDSNISEDSKQEDNIEIKANKLLQLTHIHLDRENIDEIDNLVEYLGDITNLYLQHNLIKKIENLDFFLNLKFLTLSHNQISRIENLTSLTRLRLLDLSYNSIDEIHIKELPKSISFFDIRNNPCNEKETWSLNSYESKLRNYFVNLIQLNGEDLSDSENEDLVSPSKESFLNEENQTEKEDTFESVQEKIIERSRIRQKSDVGNFDQSWSQKKSKLESLSKSTDEKLRQSFQNINFKR